MLSLYALIIQSPQFVEFRARDGSVVLYFDPTTKLVWDRHPDSEPDTHMDVDGGQMLGETSGGNVQTSQDFIMDDFSDDDINAAARLATTVSPP